MNESKLKKEIKDSINFNNIQLFKRLIKKYKKNKDIDDFLLLSLKFSSIKGYFEITKIIYKMCSKFKDNNHIIFAIKNGHFEITKFFIEDNLEVANFNNNLFIELATKYGHDNISSYLFSIPLVKKTLIFNHPDIYNMLIKKEILEKINLF